jgi:hypothetical protein
MIGLTVTRLSRVDGAIVVRTVPNSAAYMVGSCDSGHGVPK